MAAVQRLCGRVILIDSGKLIADDVANKVVSQYLYEGTGQEVERIWDDINTAPGDDVARLHAVRVRIQNSEAVDEVDIRTPIQIEVDYWNLKPDNSANAVLIFSNEQGVELFTTADNHTDLRHQRRPIGKVRSTCWIPGNFLAEGRIDVLVSVGSFNTNTIHALEREAISFVVVDKSEGDGVRGEFSGRWPGVVRPMLKWTVEFEPDQR